MSTIAVLGAGYGGVSCVKRLEKLATDHEILWINENDYHLVQHEVHRVIYDESVKGALVIPIEEIKRESTEFVEARVEGFEFSEKYVDTTEGEFKYDYLVIALGQRTNFYGVEGVEENAHTLKSLNDALEIRNAVKNLVKTVGSRRDKGRVVIGGAGLSGIQVAGEIADYLDKELEPRDYQIKIVEALDRIMPKEKKGEDLRRAIRRALRAKGIMTVTNDPIVEATGDEVRLESGETLDYDIFVWTGGITSHDFVGDKEVKRGPRDAMVVDSTLESVDFKDVFVVGDAAHVEDIEGRTAPATAWAARDEGRVAGTNVVRKIEDKELVNFELDPTGTLVSVGRSAVGKVEGRVVTGRAAKVLKRGAAVRHITNVAGAGRGARSVLKDL